MSDVVTHDLAEGRGRILDATRPYVGATIIFVAAEDYFAFPKSCGQRHPAIVTRVLGTNRVNLHVFVDRAGSMSIENVPPFREDRLLMSPGGWCWPEVP